MLDALIRKQQGYRLYAGKHIVERIYLGDRQIWEPLTQVPLRTGVFELEIPAVEIELPPAVAVLESLVYEQLLPEIEAEPPAGLIIDPLWTNARSFGNRTSLIDVTTSMGIGVGSVGNIVNGVETVSDSSNAFQFTSGQTGSVVFDLGTPHFCGGLLWIKSTTSSHGTWKIQGSNNGIDWTDISDEVAMSATHVYFACDPDVAYRYIRTLVVSSSTSSAPWNREVWLKVSEQGTNTFETVAPAYALPFGTGARQRAITIGGTLQWSTTGGQAAIDGSHASQIWFSPNSQTGRTWEFTFDQPVRITAFRLFASSTTTHGTWQWEVYDEGEEEWQAVGSSFTLSGSTGGTEFTEMSGMTEHYSQHRLVQLSGATSNSPYIQEIEFQAGYNRYFKAA